MVADGVVEDVDDSLLVVETLPVNALEDEIVDAAAPCWPDHGDGLLDLCC